VPATRERAKAVSTVRTTASEATGAPVKKAIAINDETNTYVIE